MWLQLELGGKGMRSFDNDTNLETDIVYVIKNTSQIPAHWRPRSCGRQRAVSLPTN